MSKILIVYWSGTGNTEKMSELIEKGAVEAGAEVVVKQVGSVTADEIGAYDVLAIGSPAMGGEVIEEDEVEPFVESISGKSDGRKIGLFGSYGWGDGEWMESWTERMKGYGANLLDSGLIVNEAPEGAEEDKCIAWGKQLAQF